MPILGVVKIRCKGAIIDALSVFACVAGATHPLLCGGDILHPEWGWWHLDIGPTVTS
jgi:hypothetical protein